ncbi:hypothetical protein [Castellaniella sp.]|uniref:hypothetical protein n=1 Tax=Castellaniella sp. TaxID=1955812 RepID=UPI002AFE5FBA|nr:hypothetical protein [Castellaniella sp.]
MRLLGGPRDQPDWVQSAHILSLREADTFRQRLLGLHAWEAWGETPWGLVLPRCRAVQGWGLAQPIDLLFLGKTGLVLRVLPQWPPGRFAACPGAWAALELPPAYCRYAGWQRRIEHAWRHRAGQESM